MGRTPHRASSSKERSRRKATIHDIKTARQMLPLVRSIVSDIVDWYQQRQELTREQSQLERSRHSLEWDQRQRRYIVDEELSRVRQAQSSAVKELRTLGIKLIDPKTGQIDFPTRINGKNAAFSWLLGESGLNFWRYEGEDVRRPIPKDWEQGQALRLIAEKHD